MQRLVFVHGSVAGGRGDLARAARRSQSASSSCSSSGRGSRLARPSIASTSRSTRGWVVDAARSPGDHLVGHSYGGVISLLAAAAAADTLGSLTVIEPPATRVALDAPGGRRRSPRAGASWWARRPDGRSRGLPARLPRRRSARRFDPPSPLPPELEQGARTLMVERGPWEAEIPLDGARARRRSRSSSSPAPTTQPSTRSATCSSARLPAERAVLPGYGHTVQRHPDFNDLLDGFVRRVG